MPEIVRGAAHATFTNTFPAGLTQFEPRECEVVHVGERATAGP
jgi:hypothetical protein